jgi:hypothetical protein
VFWPLHNHKVRPALIHQFGGVEAVNCVVLHLEDMKDSLESGEYDGALQESKHAANLEIRVRKRFEEAAARSREAQPYCAFTTN